MRVSSLADFLSTLQTSDGRLTFAQVISFIDEHYQFTPCAFTNGAQVNAVGQNSGSCKCFYFAHIHQLPVEQTLRLFCEHYQAVLDHPDGQDHQNIRQFMQQGWAGIRFEGVALT